MTPSARNTAKILARAALFLSATVALTLTGWYFSWSQVHLEDWKGDVAIVLLLPYAAVNRLFQEFSRSEQLSPSMYYLAMLLGSIGQFLYYFTIFVLVRKLSAWIGRTSADSESKGETRQ